MTRRGARPLYRSDIRKTKDGPTNSAILQYVGSGRRSLDFDSYIYGYPDGTFFVASFDDVPFPDRVAEMAEKRGIKLDALPDAPRLRHAVVEALVAEGMVQAPELLADLAVPEVYWRDWDRREMERKHTIACARVSEIARLVEADIKLRASRVAHPSYAVPSLDAILGPEPATVGVVPAVAVPDLSPPPAESRTPEPVIEEEEEVEVEEDDAAAYGPGSMTVKRATDAVVAAREAELPQRLPGGARRRLRRMAPGRYIVYGEAMDSRVDLCAAMTDGRSLGRKGREVAVIDWDGEWPVVVRRYGQGGRTVYKVETALRRAGVEVA